MTFRRARLTSTSPISVIACLLLSTDLSFCTASLAGPQKLRGRYCSPSFSNWKMIIIPIPYSLFYEEIIVCIWLFPLSAENPYSYTHHRFLQKWLQSRFGAAHTKTRNGRAHDEREPSPGISFVSYTDSDMLPSYRPPPLRSMAVRRQRRHLSETGYSFTSMAGSIWEMDEHYFMAHELSLIFNQQTTLMRARLLIFAIRYSFRQ
jgi:hypothetical protein